MNHPIPFEELPPEILKVCGPATPGPAKLMAARGMLPFASPADLVTVLYVLAFDPAPALVSAARDSLAGLPADVAKAALAADLDERVLDHVAGVFLRREDVLTVLLRNPRLDDETFERLASAASETIAEQIAGNEVRLLRRPKIIEALYLNKRVRMSTVDRVIELAVRNGLVLEGIPAFREIAAAIEGQVILESEPGGEPMPDDMLFTSALSIDCGPEWALEGEAAEASVFGDFDGAQAKKEGCEDTDVRKLGFDLSRMTVSQKIRLALLGNASHRALLIRDPNRLVAMAAIKSPSVTEQEVGVLSQSRAVAEDVVRFIADNRDWTKSYVVKVNLVNNPKCPLSHSLRFLAHLRPGDLKSLVNNKNVPQALSSAARQILQRRPGQGK